ncbi:hypothetical protein U1Q18_003524 [Sarracenia purpurea var. burkii]
MQNTKIQIPNDEKDLKNQSNSPRCNMFETDLLVENTDRTMLQLDNQSTELKVCSLPCNEAGKDDGYTRFQVCKSRTFDDHSGLKESTDTSMKKGAECLSVMGPLDEQVDFINRDSSLMESICTKSVNVADQANKKNYCCSSCWDSDQKSFSSGDEVGLGTTSPATEALHSANGIEAENKLKAEKDMPNQEFDHTFSNVVTKKLTTGKDAPVTSFGGDNGKFEAGATQSNLKPIKGFLQNNDKSKVTHGGAVWDIFRRQDVPKLLEYLQKHKKEFRHTYNLPVKSVVHPIHDQTLFLNERHLKQLKEEFDVEPWTFEQYLGEAVFIPAGCPHQVRNRQSCIKVALDFVSPENVQECVRLTEEFRLLPKNHRAKEDKLEVKKMTLYAVSSAVREAKSLMTNR